MEIIINPTKIIENEKEYNSFVKISYNDKHNLSLVGYCSNGSTGQCYDEIAKMNPNDRWTKSMVDKLVNIWKEYHLNDMCPECEHQRKLGWLEKSKKKIPLRHYRLKDKYYKRLNDLKKISFDYIKTGKIFYPSQEDVFIANLDIFLDIYGDSINDTDETIALLKYYDLYKSILGYPEVEYKQRGHIYFSKSEEGLLGKPCPICNYKYGTEWKRKEVPKDIIDWLFSLPKSTYSPNCFLK